MPQMAPMWWTFILFLTIFSLMMFMATNYFNFFKKIKLNNKTKKMFLYWMW